MLNQKVLHQKYTMTDVLAECLHKRLTFAAYRLPAHSDVTVIVQKNHELEEIHDLKKLPTKEGFLIAPFQLGQIDKALILRPDYVFREPVEPHEIDLIKGIKSGMINGMGHDFPPEISKEDYIQQVNQTITKIREGEFDKVVLSRVKLVEGDYMQELGQIFDLLCASHPNAFVYVFRIKGQCWIGATPEPLICSRGNEMATVSLAGTRTFNEQNLDIDNWNKKERIEQEYVTSYIEETLKRYYVTEYRKKGPYAKKAGNLLHLRTDFSFPSTAVGENLPLLIADLHPTSAVCGLPKNKAMNYITSLEYHKREYYSGIVGPIGLDDRLQLYVNIRCMKVSDHQLALFLGGGITADSVAEEEWDETEIKWETLLSVIHQVK